MLHIPSLHLQVPAAQRPPGAKERAIFWQAYGQADDHTRARARGWALSLALVFLAHSADNPLIARIGKRTFLEVLR